MEWRAEFQRDFSCMSVHLRVINTAHIYIYPALHPGVRAEKTAWRKSSTTFPDSVLLSVRV